MGWAGHTILQVNWKNQQRLSMCNGSSGALEASGLLSKYIASLSLSPQLLKGQACARAETFPRHVHEGLHIDPGEFMRTRPTLCSAST
jgi:hypothetical protein